MEFKLKFFMESIILAVLGTLLSLNFGCSGSKENTSPETTPSDKDIDNHRIDISQKTIASIDRSYPNLVIEQPSVILAQYDDMEIYQLYTNNYSGLELSIKMLIYHLYRTCVIGQNLSYSQENEEFYLNDSQSDGLGDVPTILQKMITELELSIEYVDGETKIAIWAFIGFLQSGDSYQLDDYYQQLTMTFASDIIFCMGFFGTDNKPYSFNRLREVYSIPKLNATEPNRPLLGLKDSFGGLIIIADKIADSKLKLISTQYKKFDLKIKKDTNIVTDYRYVRPYELICATGIYGPNFKKADWHSPATLFINSKSYTNILITNLSRIRDRANIRQQFSDSINPKDAAMMERSFSNYKQFDMLARIMPFGGSEVWGCGQPLITEVFSLWCFNQSVFLESNLTPKKVSLEALYNSYLTNLVFDILRIPEFGANVMPRPAKILVATYFLTEDCIKIEKTEFGFNFKLISPKKMSKAINKLMGLSVKLMKDKIRDELKFAPAKTIMPQRRVAWLDELNSHIWEMYHELNPEGNQWNWRNKNNSITSVFILPEPKLIRNKMGGITDVKMIHTLDFDGQMQRFAAFANSVSLFSRPNSFNFRCNCLCHH